MSERNSPGEIRDAIVQVLTDSPTPVTVRGIYEHVAHQLGKRVPTSSVRSYLQLNTPALFKRTGRGMYALNISDQQLDLADSDVMEIVNRGKAKLIRGDCFTWLAAAPENSVHAVVTDPPYGLVEYSRSEQAKLRNGKGGVWRIPPSFDGAQRAPLPRFTTLKRGELDDLRRFFASWTRALVRVLVPGGHVFVASNPLVSHIVSHAMYENGLERRGEIIRLVMTMRGGDRPKNAHLEFSHVSVMPRSMWEPWLLFRKPLEGRVQDNLRKWGVGGLRRISNDQPFGDVVRSNPTPRTEKRIAPHPSLKPQAFLRQIVRAALPMGTGVVLDTFAGAGSTLAAANSLDIDSIGIELDRDYFAMAEAAIPKLSELKVR
jgi:DNA modification methylase